MYQIYTALLVFYFCVSLVIPKTVFANDPPTLLSPSNNSVTTSNTLSWQAPGYSLSSSNPYRIQIDGDSSFSSLFRDYYTSSTHYSPTLSYGTWYWRVLARDASGNSSSWAGPWSFTLAASSPSPSSSATSSPSSSTSSSSSSSSSSASSFTVSNTPSGVNSTDSFSPSISLSLPSNPNTQFFLKGAFIKSGGSNYFGKTQVFGSWVKNSAAYSSQVSITTDGSGNYSGSLSVMPDDSDSGFTGSGDYIFKVARYSADGSGPTWSNDSTIHINAVSTSSSTSSSSQTTTSPATSYSTSPTFNTEEAAADVIDYSKELLKLGTVSGVATESSKSSQKPVEVKSTEKPKALIVIIPLVLGGLLAFYKFKLYNLFHGL